MSLDRVREAQMEQASALRQQGAALQDLADTLRKIATIQLQTVQAIKRLDRERDTPPKKSPPSSRLTASEGMQWAGVAIMLAYIAKGGDPSLLLKALFGG